MRRREFIVLAGGALVASSLAPGEAAAQAYPTRPVTLVIPFPPGGGNDALGRMVADKMSKSIGHRYQKKKAPLSAAELKDKGLTKV
jgi:tripartite-type tricarboxylate transporter receptor subunit TctC